MSSRFDSMSRMVEELTRVSKLYNYNSLASTMASSLSPLVGAPSYINDASAVNSLDIAQSALSDFETRHIIPDAALQFSVAFEAGSIMSQNSGIARALENTMNLTSKLSSVDGTRVVDSLNWIQNSGLVAVLEKNNMYQSQIAQAVEAIQTPFKVALDYQESVKNLSTGIMGLSNIVKNTISTHSVISDICKVMPSHMNLWNGEIQVNQEVLCNAADRVFARTEEWTLDSVSEAIVKEYDSEVDKQNQNVQIDKAESVNCSAAVSPQTQLDAEKVRDWIVAIITVLSFVFGFFSSSGGININIDNSFNTVHETNAYYIYECGADARFLNECYYRIVNRETVARLKHDCHSLVTGKLKTGQVIIVRDKFKKWLQIEWEDSEGNTCFGWIQNYKVSEFEHTKSNVYSDNSEHAAR